MNHATTIRLPLFITTPRITLRWTALGQIAHYVLSMLNLSNNRLGDIGTRFIEKVSEAIGGAVAPMQIRRIARAKAEAELMSAENKIQIEALKQRAAQRMELEAIRHQNSNEMVVAGALPLLSEGGSPESIDDDWINHFFSNCRNVSDEEMQTLWSKILAGESNAPGSFSRRTVNFVSLLEKKEAVLFSKLCGFCFSVGGLRIPLVMDHNDEMYDRHNINFMNLTHLDSVGMVSFSIIGHKLNHNGPIDTRYFDRQLTIIGDGQTNIGECTLTQVGLELAPICGSQPIDGFFRYMTQKWKTYLRR